MHMVSEKNFEIGEITCSQLGRGCARGLATAGGYGRGDGANGGGQKF